MFLLAQTNRMTQIYYTHDIVFKVPCHSMLPLSIVKYLSIFEHGEEQNDWPFALRSCRVQ